MARHRNYVRGRYDALLYSLSGLKSALRHEDSFRLEFLLVLVLTPLSIWLARSPLEWAALFAPLLLVLLVELLNSAIETTLDRIGTEQNELTRRAKDMGSAAVFLSLMMAGVIWGSVIYSRFF